MYKIIKINKETWKKCEIKVIDDDKYFLINRSNLEIESGYSNWA